jgi:hypothetical protein
MIFFLFEFIVYCALDSIHVDYFYQLWFWVKLDCSKTAPWKFNLEYGGTFTKLFTHFQVEICSQQLEICKSVCMFIVLSIIVETD